jgi:hypothetical protein
MPYDRITPFNEAPTAAALWIATLEAGPDGPLVRDPITGAALSIRQAATCLVAPEPADIVLLQGAPPLAFVVAILLRASGVPLVITTPGDEGLVLRAGQITIDAGTRLNLTAPQAILTLDQVTLRSRAAILVTQTAAMATGLLRAVAQRVEMTAEILVSALGSRNAVVRETDVLRAGSTLSQVEGVAASQTGSFVVTARKDVRMDAERISLG